MAEVSAHALVTDGRGGAGWIRVVEVDGVLVDEAGVEVELVSVVMVVGLPVLDVVG